MAFGDKYKKRTLELYDEYGAINDVLQHLAKEFPDIPQPDERTIGRWRTERRLQEHSGEYLKEHLEQLADVAKTILGPVLSGVRHIGGDEYEFDRTDDSGCIVPMTMKLKEVVEGLHSSIEEAYDKHRSMNLFEHFIAHMKSENPAYVNLHEYAKASPLELIERLKLLVLKKDFKGKCKVCEGWY